MGQGIEFSGMERWKPILIGISLLLLGAAIWTEALLYSQNFLWRKSEWGVRTSTDGMDNPSGTGFLATRYPLSGNRLNLGAWYGYQELRTRSSDKAKRIELQFRISSGSYLDLLFSTQGQGSSGIRLSREPKLESVFFTDLPNGKFRAKIPFEAGDLNGWHKFVVEEGQDALNIKIADREVLRLPGEKFSEGQIAIRGGPHYGAVEHVTIDYANGKVFHESFLNRIGWTKAFLLNLGILLFLFILFATCGFGLKKSNRVLHRIALFGLLWFSFDFLYWSRLPFAYPLRLLHDEMDPVVQRLEKLRFEFFAKWQSAIGPWDSNQQEAYQKNHPVSPVYCAQKCIVPKDGIETLAEGGEALRGYRVLFIGGSHSTGWGAMSWDKTYFVQSHNRLARLLGPSIALESINLSKYAYETKDALSDYYSSRLNLAPDLVVLTIRSLSTTSDYPQVEMSLEADIKKFGDWNRARGIRSVIVVALEPDYFYKSEQLLKKKKELERITQQEGVSLFFEHDILGEAITQNGGPLLRDSTHLSSFGHDEVGRGLADALLPLLRTLKVRERPAILSI